jgi:hypothetical protein
MAVLATALIVVVALVGVFGGVVGEARRAAVRAPRRPRAVSVIPVVFSLGIISSSVGAGLAKTTSPRAPTSVGETPSVSQSGLGAVPVYPGPSNEAPLPRFNLPTIYNYGPGPRHPVPYPPASPRPLLGVSGVPEPSSTPSGRELPASAGRPVSPPSCPSSLTLPPISPGPTAIGPCPGSAVALLP